MYENCYQLTCYMVVKRFITTFPQKLLVLGSSEGSVCTDFAFTNVIKNVCEVWRKLLRVIPIFFFAFF